MLWSATAEDVTKSSQLPWHKATSVKAFQLGLFTIRKVATSEANLQVVHQYSIVDLVSCCQTS